METLPRVDNTAIINGARNSWNSMYEKQITSSGLSGNPASKPNFANAASSTAKGGASGGWIGALLQLLNSTVGAGINYALTKKTNEDAFKRNKQLSELAFRENSKLMREQNNWQSEVSQALRLRAAGIDPNSGSISSHGSASGEPLSYAPYDPDVPQFNIDGAIGNALGSYKDLEQLRLSKTLTAAQAAELMSQIDKNGASAWLDRVTATLRDFESKKMAADAQSAIAKAEYDGVAYDIAKKLAPQVKMAELRGILYDNDIKELMKSKVANEAASALADATLKAIQGQKLEEEIPYISKRFDLEESKVKAAIVAGYIIAGAQGLSSISDIIGLFMRIPKMPSGGGTSSSPPPQQPLTLPSPEKPSGTFKNKRGSWVTQTPEGKYRDATPEEIRKAERSIIDLDIDFFDPIFNH